MQAILKKYLFPMWVGQIVTLKLSKYKNKRILHFNENLKIT